MEIQNAQDFQALSIARLIMQAMNYDCCRYFTGPDHTLDDFERVMTSLVLADNSQYSYKNTIVAIGDDGGLCGACVFGRDFSSMPDETQAGELYIDSIAVPENCRGKGIATALLNATVDKARGMGLPAVGLLVDTGNPKAEKLYARVGFKTVGENSWGGHAMKHMQIAL